MRFNTIKLWWDFIICCDYFISLTYMNMKILSFLADQGKPGATLQTQLSLLKLLTDPFPPTTLLQRHTQTVIDCAVDNRPSKPVSPPCWKKNRENIVTCDMWHVTCDVRHVTHDTLHSTHESRDMTCDTVTLWHIVTGGGRWTFSLRFSSLTKRVTELFIESLRLHQVC